MIKLLWFETNTIITVLKYTNPTNNKNGKTKKEGANPSTCYLPTNIKKSYVLG